MLNSEMYLIAELLNDSSQITATDIDSEWFESSYFKTIAEAVNRLKGLTYSSEEVYREMRTINFLEAGTLDDLEMLKGNANGSGITHELARQVHSGYLDRKIKHKLAAFSATLSKSDGESLQRLLEERQAINHIKQDGRLEQAYRAFSDGLDKPADALKTFAPIDTFLGGGITGGKLIVLAGRPATGKTALALNIMMSLFEKNEGVRSDFFTFEMGQNELMIRLVSRATKINSLLFIGKDKLTAENKAKARQSYEAIKDTNDMRVFTSEYSSLNDIKAAIKKRAVPGKYVAFVDYAGLITVNDTRKNERQMMNEVTREFKKLTTDLNITIFLLAQLNRGIEHRQTKKPVMSDLKESGSLEQDANVVMLLSASEKDPKKIACDIAKNREGMTGVAPFTFTKQFMTFDVDYEEWRG